MWPLTQGAGVTVAVLDTGVQASLPDLRGVVLRGADVSDGDSGGDGASGDTDADTGNDGHGTAVAVLIAGQGYGTGIAGIAPRARILPVKVGSTGADSVAAAAAGIRLAVRHGARVINMSFGGQVPSPRSCDPVLANAIGYAVEHDVVLVAAAGDAGVLPGPMEPASCAGVLAVAGVGPGGSLWPGSTREPYVAVAAAGEQITFAGLDGRHSTTATGTSFSSALVAGAAALIRARYPHMPWYQVDQRLIDTAAAAGPQVPSDAYGYGVVNLAEAVNATAYPLSRSAPDPVYARFRAWLAGQPRACQDAAQPGSGQPGPGQPGPGQPGPGQPGPGQPGPGYAGLVDAFRRTYYRDGDRRHCGRCAVRVRGCPGHGAAAVVPPPRRLQRPPPAEGRPAEHGPAEHGPAEHRPAEHRPAETQASGTRGSPTPRPR